MSDDDAVRLMSIITFAIAYRNQCNGVISNHAEVKEEAIDIITKYFGVKVTDDNDETFQDSTESNIRQTDIKSEVESC